VPDIALQMLARKSDAAASSSVVVINGEHLDDGSRDRLARLPSLICLKIGKLTEVKRK
jgi:hypothetical protein